MLKTSTVYRILIGKPVEKVHLKRQKRDGKLIIRFFFKWMVVRMKIGLKLLVTVSVCWFVLFELWDLLYYSAKVVP